MQWRGLNALALLKSAERFQVTLVAKTTLGVGRQAVEILVMRPLFLTNFTVLDGTERV